MAVVELFRALGDETRLEMVKRLSTGKSHTISTVSSGLDISRQGARKHLQILADAKIVLLRPKGRDTDVVLLKDTLDKGKSFIESIEKQWDMRLNALKNYVEES